MKDYKGKVCGITGAASGIGKAFALYAAEQGMRIALIDIEGDRIEEVKRECEVLGSPKVVAIPTDVSEYEQVRMSVKRIMAEFGHIDVFFSNAGVGGAGTLGNIPPQDWDWITSVNFLGMAYYVTEVLPIMKEQGTEAHFLFTVSIGGLQPGMRIQSAYTASKHAALSLAESVRDYADNFAPYIGVTAFCPEYINTEIWDSEKRRPERFKSPTIPSMRLPTTMNTVPTLKSASRIRVSTPGSSGPVCSAPWKTTSYMFTRTCTPTRCSAIGLPA